MTSRLRMAAAVWLTTVAALVGASPALAIDNGVPDDAVALVSGGGDRICRAMNHPLRLDISATRAFYGDYLQLP